MPIKRTVVYTCDCCGREIVFRKERYQEIFVVAHNYANLMNDGRDERYVYCDDCSCFMAQAIRAIPRIRELSGTEEEK